MNELTTTSKLTGLISGEKFQSAVKTVLPKHCSPDRFVRLALSAVTRNPLLQQCDPATVMQCLMSLSQYGLEPDGRRAHLIPYRNAKRNVYECTLILDYKGLAELVLKTGLVSTLHADTVCDKDDFEYDRGQILKHRINFREPRGEPYAAYAICRMKDGAEKAEVLSRDEIEAVRKRSRAGDSGPWVTDWSEMAKKTAFRRLSKWLPLTPEVHDAIASEDETINVDSIVSTEEKTETPLIAATPIFSTPPEKRRGRPPKVSTVQNPNQEVNDEKPEVKTPQMELADLCAKANSDWDKFSRLAFEVGFADVSGKSGFSELSTKDALNCVKNWSAIADGLNQ